MRFYSLLICCLALTLGFHNVNFAQDNTGNSKIVWNDGANFYPSCGPIQTGNCGSWMFLAQYLYWQPRSDAWPYVERATFVGGAFTETATERVFPKYHSGVRLAGGYSRSNWDIDVVWTHLVTRDTASLSGTTLLPVWVGPVIFAFATDASANLNLTINFADVDFGYTLGCSECFLLHPHIGYRGVWVQNRLGVNYTFDFGGGTRVPLFTNNKIDFQGNGLRVGLDAEWNFWRGLSLVEKSGVGLLWSKISVDQRITGIDPRSTFDTLRKGAPIFDIFVGLSYDRCCSWRWLRHFNAHIGWEENYILGALPLESYLSVNLSSRPLRGNLSLRGLTTGITLFF